MSLIQHEAATDSTQDSAAIEELHEMVSRQRTAFLADPFPSLQERQELLGALAGMVMSHRNEIEAAMSADFGVHPRLATDLIEVLGVAGRAAYGAAQLESWMAPEPRYADLALFGDGRAFVQPQPKGVGGQHQPVELPLRLVSRAAGRDAGRGQSRRPQAL